MLTEYFEPFTLVERTDVPDGLGSALSAWQDVRLFRGGLTHTAGTEHSVSGRLVLRTEPVLLHEPGVDLHPGDYVRRERDATLWRIRSASADMRTPAFSGLNFAQVPVEKVILA